MISKLFVFLRLSSSNVGWSSKRIGISLFEIVLIELEIEARCLLSYKYFETFFWRWLIHREVLACGKIQRLPRFSHRGRVFSLNLFRQIPSIQFFLAESLILFIYFLVRGPFKYILLSYCLSKMISVSKSLSITQIRDPIVSLVDLIFVFLH